jgi:hypothetical protein
MDATHITSIVVHGGAVTAWSNVLTILVPPTILLTTVAAYPGNVLFNHLINLENSSTEPSFVTTRSAFQL